MSVLPSQLRGVRLRYGFAAHEVGESLWAIDPNGRRAGAAAINRVLAELGGGWALVAAMYGVPGISWLEEVGYRWVARHRSLLSRIWSTVPECERPGVECE